MTLEDIRKKISTKKGNLNGNYKIILNGEEIELLKQTYPEYKDLRNLCYALLNNGYKKCVVCSKIMPFDKNKKRMTCSKKCKNISKGKTQRKNLIEKYGVINTFQLQTVKDKIKETNLKRYGVEHHTQAKEYKEKYKATMLEKHGVEHQLARSDIKKKIKETNLKRYGHTNYLASEEGKVSAYKKHVNAIYNDFGIKFTVEQVKKFRLNPALQQYTKEYLEKVLEGTVKKDDIDKMYLSSYSRYEKYKIHGIEVFTNSTGELDIHNFLNKLGVEFHVNDRKVIKPLELDIYIPKYKLAIEFNGDYWHCERFKDKYYHQNKTKLCNDVGITLIHIYEHKYSARPDIYYSILKAKLGFNKKIHARKCKLKTVSVSDEKDFLTDYHLKGYAASSICFGLYFNDELVSMCSFKKSRFSNECEYELLRNCTKSNVTVVGGLSKLISVFKKTYKQKNVICYSDASISYNKGGIITEPNYVWFNNIIYSRYQTMKHLLPKLLGDNFDEKKSESENMFSNGFCKIYDAGNYKTII